MAVTLSVLRAGRPLLPRKIPRTHFCYRDCVGPSAILWLEGLGQLKNPVTSSGIESATFRLVVYCLNQLHYGGKIYIGISKTIFGTYDTTI
jgi:hypothetical protein